MVHSGKWIFIRFNPDSYIDIKGKRRNPKIEIRLEKLKDAILLQMKRIDTDSNNELVEIVKLYYNENLQNT